MYLRKFFSAIALLTGCKIKVHISAQLRMILKRERKYTDWKN